MKIQILSDLHMEFASYEYQAVDADVLILAGDIHVGEKGLSWALDAAKGREVIYVLGNHEFYNHASPHLIEKLKDKALGTHVHLLENRSVRIGGVRFLGSTLWTDFHLWGDSVASMAAAQLQMNDYRKIRLSPKYRKIDPDITFAWHRKALKWLKNECKRYCDEPLVVITHHAPSIRSIADVYRSDPLCAAFASDLEDFITDSTIQLWIHGHLHNALDYTIGSTRIVCNPLGYPGEPVAGFNPLLTMDIKK